MRINISQVITDLNLESRYTLHSQINYIDHLSIERVHVIVGRLRGVAESESDLYVIYRNGSYHRLTENEFQAHVLRSTGLLNEDAIRELTAASGV